MPTILGKEFSDRIARMETDVIAKTGKPVRYEMLVGDRQELLCEGECEWSPDGAVIRLLEESDEYDCAHELAHALMYGDGFPSATPEVQETDEAFKRALLFVTDAVHHVVLNSAYLPGYGFSEAVKKQYAEAIDEMLSHPEKLRDQDDPKSFDVTFHATGLLELFFGARSSWGRVKSIIEPNAPNTWRLAAILVASAKNYLHPDPFQVRRVLVDQLIVLDHFIKEQGGLKVGFLERAIVQPLLRPKQAPLAAKDVFYLGFSSSPTCYKRATLRLKEDKSGCFVWLCRDERDVDWTKRTLSESTALQLLEKTDENGFRIRLARPNA